MLLYLQIKRTIICWHTHTTPWRAVEEENSSPRNPCKLPVILTHISTREKVMEKILNISLAAQDTLGCGQSTAIPGFEMILCTRRGSASVSMFWKGNPADSLSCEHQRTKPSQHGSAHPCRCFWKTEFGWKQAPMLYHSWALSRHVNVHAFSWEPGFCVPRLRLPVPITSKMVPSHITTRPRIPSLLKIWAQLHVLEKMFDKRPALSLFAVNRQYGSEHLEHSCS